MPKTAPLQRQTLRQIARERFKDAQALLRSKRYDGGMYLCGYAVELALKARICQTLRWPSFPTDRNKYRSFFVHDLDLLLNLSGRERFVKTELLSEWSVVGTWDPEARYTALDEADESTLVLMIAATNTLLRRL